MRSLALFLLFVIPAFAFTGKKAATNQFVVCIVHGDYDQKKGHELAQEFRTATGAMACRLDAVSKKLFVVFEEGKITRETILNFFSPKNMKATCFHFGKHGVDQVPDLNANECK